MRLILRLIFYALILALLLALLGLISLPLLVDTQTFKNRVLQQIEQRSGIEVTIDGELDLTLYPWLGVRTDTITLRQPDVGGRESQPFFTADFADIRLKLLPLLKKQWEIDEVVLQSPRFYLRVDADGRSNLDWWQSRDKEQTRQLLSGWWRDFTRVKFAGLSLDDGEFLVDDQSREQQLRVDNIRIGLNAREQDKLYDLKATAQYRQNQQLPVDISLQSSVEIDPEYQSISFIELLSGITRGQQSLVATGKTLTATPYELLATGFELAMDSGEALAIRVQPRIQVSAFDFDFASGETGNIAFSLFEDRLELNAIGDIRLRSDQGILQYTGQASLDNIDPRRLTEVFRLDYAPADDRVFRRLGFGSRFNGSSRGIYFSDTAIQLDESVFRGNFALVDFARPYYRFDFLVDQIEPAPYFGFGLSHPGNGHQQTKDLDKLVDTRSYLGFLSLFRDIRASGFLHAQMLKHHELRYRDVNLQLKSDLNGIEAEKTARLGIGRSNNSLTWTRGENGKANIRIDKNYSDVPVGELMDGFGYETGIDGIGEISVNLTMLEQQQGLDILGKLVASGESGEKTVIALGE